MSLAGQKSSIWATGWVVPQCLWMPLKQKQLRPCLHQPMLENCSTLLAWLATTMGLLRGLSLWIFP